MLKILLICFYVLFTNFVKANDVGSNTGFQIPRFVSLKSNDVNLRIGSSTNYPIILKYTIKNLPVEIIDEQDMWRKIMDIDGNQGWIHKNLIKGDRYAIINQPYKSPIQIFNKPNGKKIGVIGKRNIVKIKICLKQWCLFSHKKNKGWINKKNLWGVYSYEKINVPFYQPLIDQLWKINF